MEPQQLVRQQKYFLHIWKFQRQQLIAKGFFEFDLTIHLSIYHIKRLAQCNKSCTKILEMASPLHCQTHHSNWNFESSELNLKFCKTHKHTSTDV